MTNEEKALKKFLTLPYTVMLQRDASGEVIARIKELEGCIAHGQDEIEAIGNLEIAKALWLETALKAGRTIPRPEEEADLPSGKFLARVPRSLHKKLNELAEAEGVSLNQVVAAGLAEIVGRRLGSSGRGAHEGSPQQFGRTYAQTSPRLRLVMKDENAESVFEEERMAGIVSIQDEFGGRPPLRKGA